MTRTPYPARSSRPAHGAAPDSSSGSRRTVQPKPAPSGHPTWEELLGER